LRAAANAFVLAQECLHDGFKKSKITSGGTMFALIRSLKFSKTLCSVALASLLAVSPMAHAVYNANMDGALEMMSVYADGDYIYFRLVNQPSSHPTCNPAYFVILQDVPENRRNQMLAVLLAAKASGQSLGVGYDSQGDCAHGFIHVHRVG
jgi:hypothetical protein